MSRPSIFSLEETTGIVQLVRNHGHRFGSHSRKMLGFLRGKIPTLSKYTDKQLMNKISHHVSEFQPVKRESRRLNAGAARALVLLQREFPMCQTQFLLNLAREIEREVVQAVVEHYNDA